MSGTSGLKSRVSPLIVGLAAIAITLVVAEGYLLFRPHSPKASAVVTAASPDDSDRQPIAPPPALPPAAAPSLPAVSAPAAPEATAPDPPQAVAAPPAEAATPEAQHAAVKKRALLMADHNQRVVLEADEQAFEALRLPDQTRAAVRQINGNYVKTTRDFLEANPPAWSPGEQLGANLAKSDESDRTRRAALKEALGADGVTTFETAEYAAVRRLRRQYSAQWARELESQAPLPEGLPPSPH
jgi:hypothetical protein